MRRIEKWENFKSFCDFVFSIGTMAKIKNTRKKTGLAPNPFSKVNQHGVALLDVDKVQQLCEQKGKDATDHVRMREHFD